jgi:hypothetical protein
VNGHSILTKLFFPAKELLALGAVDALAAIDGLHHLAAALSPRLPSLRFSVLTLSMFICQEI